MITFKAKDTNGEIINSALSPFTFPAGEAHIKKSDDQELQPTEIAILQFSPESMHTDLFKLQMWSNYISETNNTVRQVALIPYFPGARADRGAPFGAGVYAMSIYGGTSVDEVITFDPHSEVVVGQLNCDPEYFKIIVVNSHELLAQPHMWDFMDKYTGVIAPDKGAVKRATSFAMARDLPVYTVEKTRDFETLICLEK